MTIGLTTRLSARPMRNQVRLSGRSRPGYESATTANAIATIIDHHRSSPPNAQGHKAKTANTTANTIPNERSEAPVTLRRETMGSLIDIWLRPISPTTYVCYAITLSQALHTFLVTKSATKQWQFRGRCQASERSFASPTRYENPVASSSSDDALSVMIGNKMSCKRLVQIVSAAAAE